MKKLAIVNGAPRSEMLAPFNDPDYEIWVLGNRIANYDMNCVDMIFEIHNDLSEHGDVQAYIDGILACGKPVVVDDELEAWGDGSQIIRFPYEDVMALRRDRKPYLTSSTVYMLGYALLRGYQHIRLFGVDMAMDELEYFYQRPCLENWIGFAEGLGVDIAVHESSPVGRSDYVEGKGAGGKPQFSLPPFTMAEFGGLEGDHQRKMDEIKAQIEALENKRLIHFGAKQVYERLKTVARAIEQGQPIHSLKQDLLIK